MMLATAPMALALAANAQRPVTLAQAAPAQDQKKQAPAAKPAPKAAPKAAPQPAPKSAPKAPPPAAKAPAAPKQPAAKQAQPPRPPQPPAAKQAQQPAAPAAKQPPRPPAAKQPPAKKAEPAAKQPPRPPHGSTAQPKGQPKSATDSAPKAAPSSAPQSPAARQRNDDRRDDAKDRNNQRRDDASDRNQDRNQPRRDDARDRRDDRRDDARDRRDDRRDNANDRRDDRREDARDRREDRRDDARERQNDRRDDARDRREQQQRDANRARRIEDVKRERRETREGNRTIIREPGRTIIREGNRTIIRHDEAERYRRLRGYDVKVERRGNQTYTVVNRPGGIRIITVDDANGRMLRRIRRYPDGREVVIIDNRPRGQPGFFINIAPPVVRIPRERYIVDAAVAPPALLFDTLVAPPVDDVPRAYSLDEIRASQPLRERMRRIDLDGITFETGSWEITPEEAKRLEPIANAVQRAIEKNPAEVFMIEGYTDAVGDPTDNLSLSDRRAEAVAIVLTEQYQIPPENLTTQGYGEQYLKVPTQGPERANRRVTVRRITPLLAGKSK
jgi:outer membrane protein OmpA-like peptidoglycan-associated protein